MTAEQAEKLRLLHAEAMKAAEKANSSWSPRKFDIAAKADQKFEDYLRSLVRGA